jgi:hypothetical protein
LTLLLRLLRLLCLQLAVLTLPVMPRLLLLLLLLLLHLLLVPKLLLHTACCRSPLDLQSAAAAAAAAQWSLHCDQRCCSPLFLQLAAPPQPQHLSTAAADHLHHHPHSCRHMPKIQFFPKVCRLMQFIGPRTQPHCSWRKITFGLGMPACSC